MQTLIITFQLDGLDPAAYAHSAEAMAPQFVEVPGLLAKTWLADEATNTYGGVYFFADRTSVDAYLASPIVQALHANPHFSGITALVSGVLEAPSRITHGAVAASAA